MQQSCNFEKNESKKENISVSLIIFNNLKNQVNGIKCAISQFIHGIIYLSFLIIMILNFLNFLTVNKLVLFFLFTIINYEYYFKAKY